MLYTAFLSQTFKSSARSWRALCVVGAIVCGCNIFDGLDELDPPSRKPPRYSRYSPYSRYPSGYTGHTSYPSYPKPYDLHTDTANSLTLAPTRSPLADEVEAERKRLSASDQRALRAYVEQGMWNCSQCRTLNFTRQCQGCSRIRSTEPISAQSVDDALIFLGVFLDYNLISEHSGRNTLQSLREARRMWDQAAPRVAQAFPRLSPEDRALLVREQEAALQGGRQTPHNGTTQAGIPPYNAPNNTRPHRPLPATATVGMTRAEQTLRAQFHQQGQRPVQQSQRPVHLGQHHTPQRPHAARQEPAPPSLESIQVHPDWVFPGPLSDEQKKEECPICTEAFADRPVCKCPGCTNENLFCQACYKEIVQKACVPGEHDYQNGWVCSFRTAAACPFCREPIPPSIQRGAH